MRRASKLNERWQLGRERAIIVSTMNQNLNAILTQEEFEYVSSEFQELIEENRSSIVELATGRYVVCMIPTPLKS
jgi:hypothetical protein